jgi:type I restriction enzyme S subunit
VSALLQAREPSARYLEAAQPALVRNFEALAKAADGVAQLRKLILTLAVRGKLVPQDPHDQPATKLLGALRADKAQLVAAGKAKRDRQLPPIATDEQPYELPPHWEWVRLGELVELITSGSRDWAEHYSASGAIFIRMGNLSRGSFRLRMQSVQHVRPPTSGEGSRTSLQEGDLLLSITGDVGLLGLVPPGFGEAYINQHTCLIRWLPRLRGVFMPVQLLSPFAQSQFNAPQRGIKNSFRLTDVSGLVVALPPLAEQARIVARVDELMRLCDALEAKGRLEAEQHGRLLGTLLGTLTASSTPEELAANWQRVADHFELLLDRPAAVDALEQTILQLAVRGLLVRQDPNDKPADLWVRRINVGRAHRRATAARPTVANTDRPGLPAGWCITNVASVAECLDYIRRPIKKADREAGGGSVPYYGANGQVGWINEHLFDEDLVLVVEDETFIGRTKPFSYVVHGKSWVNNHAHVLRPLGGLSADYLNLCLERYDFIPLTSGTTNRRKLTQPGLLNAEFMIGPLEEQVRILAHVTELRRLCADLRQRLTACQNTQAHLAEALVNMALD